MASRTQAWHVLLLTLAVGPLAAWLVANHLNVDFWYDELYTLRHFVYVPMWRTVTYYPAANNHILFSLLANAYCPLVGASDIWGAMDAPWRIRLLNAAAVAGTFIYLYRTSCRHLNRGVARLAVLLLATTIPFANFALQFRGYVWSIFSLCAGLGHLWNFERDGRRRDALWAAAFVVMALYTIPLNLYFVGALGLIYLVRRQPRPAALVAGAAAVSALLYLPVAKELLTNEVVQSHGMFRLDTLLRVLPRTLLYFTSERYVVVAFAAWALLRAGRSGRAAGEHLADRARFCAALLVLPFGLSFVRGDAPFLRVFVNLSPVFALLGGIVLYAAIRRVVRNPRTERAVLLLITVCCHGSFAVGMHRITRRLEADIAAGRKSQDIYYNYYQAHYHPRQLFQAHADALRTAPLVGYYPGDKVALALYTNKLGVPCYPREALEEVAGEAARFHVVTAFPNQFRAEAERLLPGWRVERVTAAPSFLNLFRLTNPGRSPGRP